MIRRSISDAEAAPATEHDARDDDLDQFVSAFEAAHLRGIAEDLADFLPSKQHPQYLDILCEIVRIDLEFHWRCGQPRQLDDYGTQFPELFVNRQTLEAVCFEEYRLRRLACEAVSTREYQSRYGVDTGAWETPDASSSRAATADRARTATPERMPRVGDSFLGFELIRELGRGTFATVYLARQAELADRPVAVKISCERPSESQILARLQHTNIVPIYSTHQVGEVRLVCMPYFGETTLADVLRAVRDRGGLPPSGAHLVDTLRTCRDRSDREKASVKTNSDKSNLANVPLGADVAPSGPAAGLRAIAALDYVQAVVWISSRLAEGLEHAHERGVLHLDLKPANVLMADDGQPMLLDFNLSQTVRDGNAESVGGTLPYMAPENLAAFWHGDCGGDVRGDIYSLGVVLFELLTGRLPFPLREGIEDEALEAMVRDRRGPPPGPRDLNRAVSPAVDAIVRKCLMSDPESRYASAAALHEDLDRHLRSLPLCHVREPSLVERAEKWRRRHPATLSATGITLLAALVVALMAAGLMVRGNRLAEFQALAALDNFHNDYRTAQIAALDAPTAAGDRLGTINAACRKALDHFSVLNSPQWYHADGFQSLSPQKQDAARAEVGELLFLLAAVTRLEAETVEGQSPHGKRTAIERAMELNRRAETALPPGQTPGAIWQQRASFAADLGVGDMAQKSLERAIAAAPQSPRDFGMAACALVQQRRFRAALPLWQRATRGDPQNAWAWYGLGNCCERLGSLSPAVASYTACIALKPDYYGWYFSRGTVYLRQKEFLSATADFDEVSRLCDSHVEAHINRAIARLGLGRSHDAIDDLHTALALGGEKSRLHLLLARAWNQLGDSDAARREVRRGAELPPDDEIAWVARAFTQAPGEPAAALEDVNRALQRNAYYLPAWESKAHLLAERLDQPDQAVAVLDDAIALFPEATQLVAARGVLRARQSKTDAAKRDAQAALKLDPTPEVQYQAACIYALLSRQSAAEAPRSLELLAAALRGGYGSELLRDDKDLAAIRSFPQYQQLLSAVASLRLEAKSSAAAGDPN